VNQYIERNLETGECRLIGTEDIIPNLRYDSDNIGRNYAVTSFKEKRSTDNTTATIATTYTPVRKVMIMLGDKLVEWDGKEYWKPLEWNDYYQVSTWGNVRNAKGNYMYQGENDKGYRQVQLWKNGKSKHFRVNRLVAEAFLPNPNNLSDVDHIAPNSKKNNMVDNLQWLSHIDNIRKDLCKPVQLLDYDTEEVLKEFDSIADTANYLHGIGKGRTIMSVSNNISNCLTGRTKSAYGYKFRYKD
jgi:hypothetical protein